ncbi:MAG: hypothetical protein MK165_06300 [Pirellulaceae bacterium]|nr:hypothetical protein [Pirellulaceae bacterium]
MLPEKTADKNVAESISSTNRQGPTQIETTPPVVFDDWEFENELLATRRLVDSAGAMPTAKPKLSGSDSVHHTHPPHELSSPPGITRLKTRQRRKRRSSLAAWSVLSVGAMVFTCGGVLLGLSLFHQRPELWDLGIPFVIGGQAALLLGFIMQLEGIWRSHQDTSKTLDELDNKLDELQQTTIQLSTQQSDSSKSFYAHMAEGASPELLLADVKGQLDMLAIRLGNQKQ